MAFVVLISPRAEAEPNVDQASRWVVDAKTALELADHGATVLDTRGVVAFARRHLPGAVRVDWTAFSRKKVLTGGSCCRAKRFRPRFETWASTQIVP